MNRALGGTRFVKPALSARGQLDIPLRPTGGRASWRESAFGGSRRGSYNQHVAWSGRKEQPVCFVSVGYGEDSRFQDITLI